MKKYILPTLVMAFLITGTAFAKPTTADPFKPLWDAIAGLQQQIDGIELLPGPQGPQGEIGPMGPQGEQGPQGPKGEDGKDARHGAGNILFFVERWDGDGVALKDDGVVYTLGIESDGTPSWRLTSNNPAYSNVNPPVPVQDIVVWNAGSLIDKNGDIWIYRSNNTWTNARQP